MKKLLILIYLLLISNTAFAISLGDLKYATYSQAIYVLDEVGKKLPKIFKSVKQELSIKIKEKHEKSL